jgi:glycosyltransferase involved in cell wall biosynthesis/predicted metal-dependent phosphoesterase TrpH
MKSRARCDLHVHSVYSTDTGNYALRRARLGESYTEPGRVYEVCRRRGMTLVTISDHNTLEGALRIAHLPGTFLSEEVTTRFPEDDVPLHVLVWGLSEEDHRDLQPYRGSVYELAALLRERRLAHALAHPLYRMGPPLTVSHVERLMLLFAVWEVLNGARPRESNLLARRLAEAATPAYLGKLSERHGLEPEHDRIAFSAGSDDHSALDIACAWSQAAAPTPEAFLEAIRAGRLEPCGSDGSTVKLAHALGALVLNAYRRGGGTLPEPVAQAVSELFDRDAENAAARHEEIDAAAGVIARTLLGQVRAGGISLETLPMLGGRLATVMLAAALEAPFAASLKHNADTQQQMHEIERAFFGTRMRPQEQTALVFTDTFDETNGVAGTMRRLALEAGAGRLPLTVVTTRATPSRGAGLIVLPAAWSLPLPAYESLELRCPSLREVLAEAERLRPDVIHVATPGPVGLVGLAAAKLLGIPAIGSYHTELGPYALLVTRDLVLAELLDAYVRWFYRQCGVVLAPTQAVADALVDRGFERRPSVWGRGVDSNLFSPLRRDDELRRRLLETPEPLAPGELLLLSVGRLSEEKRVQVLLQAFGRLVNELPGLRLAIVGDGPARARLEQAAPAGVRFLGELQGVELARVYASADVFCFPSTSDTFGQVLLEAAASGLPAIAAAIGGALELVRHGQTGLLVPPDDPGSLAAAIQELAMLPRGREELGAAARRLALERTWERSFQELRSAYAEVLARPRGESRRLAAALV